MSTRPMVVLHITGHMATIHVRRMAHMCLMNPTEAVRHSINPNTSRTNPCSWGLLYVWASIINLQETLDKLNRLFSLLSSVKSQMGRVHITMTTTMITTMTTTMTTTMAVEPRIDRIRQVLSTATTTTLLIPSRATVVGARSVDIQTLSGSHGSLIPSLQRLQRLQPYLALAIHYRSNHLRPKKTVGSQGRRSGATISWA